MKRQIKSIMHSTGLSIRLLKHVPFGERWEHDVRSLMGEATRQLTLFDVGANVGQTAKSLVEVFPNSKIYSFEPVPSTFAKLKQTTMRLAQVECVNMALGDRPGEAVMTSDRDGRNTLITDAANGSSVVATVGTIDDFCANRGIQRIDLLKIDTEGFEMFVLDGASQMLAKGSIDFVVAECDFARRPEEPHGDFFGIHAMLSKRGFSIVSLYTCGVDDRGWVWGNMLMMRKNAAPGLRTVVSPYWR